MSSSVKEKQNSYGNVSLYFSVNYNDRKMY